MRVFDRVNVETSMKEMQQQMKRLEGTFFSVTNQLKSAIEGLRPSNSNSQTDSRREREGGSNEKLYETCSRPILSSREYESSSSSEEEHSDRSALTSSNNRTSRTCSKPKLPPFTGKETWKVWCNRFEEVADRQKWSEEER